MYSYFVQCLREIKFMTNHDVGSPPPERRLLDLLRDAIRRKHYSYRTEQSYVHWARRFIFFHGKRHPRELGGDEVAASGIVQMSFFDARKSAIFAPPSPSSLIV